jgi:hypothetical protein
VAGLHRAEGLSGPTRRYAIIVALLVALASLPTVAAISAGSATLGAGMTGGGTTPFIVQPPDVPIVVVPPAAAPPGVAAGPAQPRGSAQPAIARPRPAPSAGPKRPLFRTLARARPESAPRRPAAAARPPAPPPANGCAQPAKLGWRPFAGTAPAPACSGS